MKKTLVCRCLERGLVEVDDPVGDDVVQIGDLCRAAKNRDPVLNESFAEIRACHPRAVKALFEFSGNPLSDDVVLFDGRKDSGSIDRAVDENELEPTWYPVIDRERCTNCGQCNEFCLFGVYEMTDDRKVIVTSPDSCKNNCPACARICPETAIIFPKSVESPINGDELPPEEERKANVKNNVDEILGDDVYAALNARKAKRRSLLNKKKVEQALAERKRCSGGKA